MLDQCARGWTRKETDHFWCLMWNKQTYPSFPKKKDVAVGHIRKMLRHLVVDMDCAKKHLDVLG